MESRRSSRYSQSTTVVQSPSSLNCPAFPITPVIEVEVDHVPFSDSFSEMMRDVRTYSKENICSRLRSTNFRSLKSGMTECDSFNIESITKPKDLDPSWGDDEIEEILFISPKLSTPSLSTQSDLQTSLRKVLPEFDILRVLETESPVKTFLVQSATDSSVFTVKTARKKKTNRKILKNLCSEHTCLKAITIRGAAFLPRLHQSFTDGDRLYLITDSPADFTLMACLKREGPFNPDKCRFYASEIIEALDFLHSIGIIHRDIKLENVHVMTDGHIVLGDFEHSKMLSSSDRFDYCTPTECGTQEYQAPEILLGWNHTFSVDCWGFGVILCFMHFGQHPFLDGDELDPLLVMQNKIIHGQDSDHSIQSTPLAEWNLIKKCLERNPQLRLCSSQIKQHVYFSGIDWERVKAKNYDVPFIPTVSDHLHAHCGIDERIFHLQEGDYCEALDSDSTEDYLFDSDVFKWDFRYSPPQSGRDNAPTGLDDNYQARKSILKEPSQRFTADKPLEMSVRDSSTSDEVLEQGIHHCRSSLSLKSRKLRKKRGSISSNNPRSSIFSRKSFLFLSENKSRESIAKKDRFSGCHSVSSQAALPEGIFQSGKGIGYSHTPQASRSRLSLVSVASKSCFNRLGAVFGSLGKSTDNLPRSRNEVMQQIYGSSWSVTHTNEARTSTITFGIPEGLGRRVDTDDQQSSLAIISSQSRSP